MMGRVHERLFFFIDKNNSNYTFINSGGSHYYTNSSNDRAVDWKKVTLVLFWLLACWISYAIIRLSSSFCSGRGRNVNNGTNNNDLKVGALNRSILTLPMIATLIGFGFSVASHLSCYTFSVLDEGATYYVISSIPTRTDQLVYTVKALAIGFWSVDLISSGSFSLGCSSTFQSGFFPMSTATVVAKGFGIVASCFGGTSLFYYLFMKCKQIRLEQDGKMNMQQIARARKVCCWLLLLASCLQMAGIVALGRGYPCHGEGSPGCVLDYGAFTSMTAILYWILGLFAIAHLPLDHL